MDNTVFNFLLYASLMLTLIVVILIARYVDFSDFWDTILNIFRKKEPKPDVPFIEFCPSGEWSELYLKITYDPSMKLFTISGGFLFNKKGRKVNWLYAELENNELYYLDGYRKRDNGTENSIPARDGSEFNELAMDTVDFIKSKKINND